MNNQEEDVQHHANKSTVARIAPLATLVVGLVIGMVVGYSGRPLVGPQPSPPIPVTPTNAANPSTASSQNPSSSNSSPPTLIDAVVSQTRHFKGDPNAPVTIIEFGDFQ
jgi:hypothetical protein